MLRTRHTNTLAQKGPAIAPSEDAPDTGAAAQQRVVRTPAGAPVHKPAGAVASVFEAGTAARPAPAARTVIDLEAVPIYTDRPLPPPVTGRAAAANLYAQLYSRLPVGGSADLTARQKDNFLAWAKRVKVPMQARRLGPDLYGVWRTSAAEPQPTTKAAAA